MTDDRAITNEHGEVTAIVSGDLLMSLGDHHTALTWASGPFEVIEFEFGLYASGDYSDPSARITVRDVRGDDPAAFAATLSAQHIHVAKGTMP